MFRFHFISRYHFWREISAASLSMEALMNNAVPSPARVPNRALVKLRNRHLRTFRVRCSVSERNEELKGLIITSSHIKLNLEDQDMPEERFESPNNGPQKSSPDIWELFEEAQQNILYLNKQRVRAIEELNKANQEKLLLLDEIKQLEEIKQKIVKKDHLSFCWELLLRIDSMVLGSKVNAEEASDLRKLIMGCRTRVTDIFPDILEKGDAEFLADLRIFADGSRKNNVHSIHICTEMEPLVSVGSLASYITGLSRALQRKGHTVEVILPKYTILSLEEFQGLRVLEAEFYSYFNGQLHRNKIWTGVAYGIGVTLIDPIDYASFFNRDRISGYLDDFERFSYFSRASLDYLIKTKKKPDVIHIHDWETSIVGPLFWDIFAKQGLENTKILLTCHDLKSQYLEQPDKLALCGLDPTQLHRPDRLQDNTKPSFVNLLKGGVVYSNKVMIMSSLHPKGRIIQDFNYGLKATLITHKDKLQVVPIGFDNSAWDPCKDKFLPKNYDTENLEGKAECKANLQHLGELPANDSSIVVSCILHEELDIDVKVLKTVVWGTAGRDIQYIFMRISTQNIQDKAFQSFMEETKDDNVRFLDGYDESVLHLLFAGSDIILCSFHDTLLQVPLKALKYGTAPIAFAPDEDHQFSVGRNLEETSRYSQFIASSLGNMSLYQAIHEMMSDPYNWTQRMKSWMEMDFSWDGDCSDVHSSVYTTLKNL